MFSQSIKSKAISSFTANSNLTCWHIHFCSTIHWIFEALFLSKDGFNVLPMCDQRSCIILPSFIFSHKTRFPTSEIFLVYKSCYSVARKINLSSAIKGCGFQAWQILSLFTIHHLELFVNNTKYLTEMLRQQ